MRDDDVGEPLSAYTVFMWLALVLALFVGAVALADGNAKGVGVAGGLVFAAFSLRLLRVQKRL